MIVWPVNVRSDEEENFGTRLRRQFALEQVAKYRNRSDAWSALSGFTFGVGQNTTHNCRTTIWNEYFRLHALSIDAGYAPNCDTSVDSVVLNRHSQDYGSNIGDLRCD